MQLPMQSELMPPSPNHKLYSIYHHHEYGGSFYLVWSDHPPTEDEVVDQIVTADFEPEKDEYIELDSIEEIKVLKSLESPVS